MRAPRAQQQDVVGVDHRRVGDAVMCLPDRATVKSLQRSCSRRHVRKTAQADEAVGAVAIAELSDDAYSLCFLALDEVIVEDVDQRISSSGMQRVLT